MFIAKLCLDKNTILFPIHRKAGYILFSAKPTVLTFFIFDESFSILRQPSLWLNHHCKPHRLSIEASNTCQNALELICF